MFTCPEDDIHSVYLDGELPEEFVAEYEAHVGSCPKCSAKLEKLTRISNLLGDDSDSIVFTEKELDDSFARLQAKMSYSRFKKSEKRSVFDFPKFKGVQFFAAGVAAASIIAFAIPKQGETVKSAQGNFAPVARSSVKNPVNPVKIDGNLDAVHLASFLGSETPEDSVIAVSEGNVAPVQKMILHDSYGQRSFRPVKPALADYDVFYPVGQESKESSDHSKGFSFSVSSPLIKVSFQVGK